MKRFWALFFLVLCFFSDIARAVPPTINYQGRMTFSAGQPATATASVLFNLYNAASGGTSVWNETQTVTPNADGLFSVTLGAVNPLTVLPFDIPYFLDINWAGTSLTPRQPLDTAPYAFRAAAVDLPVTEAGSVTFSAMTVINNAGPALEGRSTGAVGAGVLASATGGGLALRAVGPSIFSGGPVSFTGSVDFSGATVTGLAGGVTAPLVLTSTTMAGAIQVFNTGGGPALFAQGGVSVVASSGNPAIYVQGGAGTAAAGIQSISGGTGHAVEGRNTFFGTLGILGGDPSNGTNGVYGSATNAGDAGVNGLSPAGIGVSGAGLTGVAGTGNIGLLGLAAASGQTGIVADWGAKAGSYALKVSGPAQFFGGPFSFTGSVDFTGATVTGLAGGVTAPFYLSGTTALGGAVIQGANLGAGYGVAGSNSQPGTQDISGNPLTINAGVYGYTASLDSVGVFGVSTAVTSTAGVAGRGLTGVYGESNGYGVGGEFQAVSGTGVDARGLTGVAGTAELPGGVGIAASDHGYGAGTLALATQGAALFNGPVTVTANTNPGQAAMAIQSQGPGVALYTNGGMASAYQAVTVTGAQSIVNVSGSAGRVYFVSASSLSIGSYLTVFDNYVTANSMVLVTFYGMGVAFTNYTIVVPTTGGSFNLNFSTTPTFANVDPNDGFSFIIINLQ